MSTELQTDSFLRIASISVACYDYLITLPVELRMYRSTSNLNFSRVLFILIRYTSITLLAVSNVGYFHHGFSAKACSRYYLVAPAFKVLQIMISQVIIGYRTWNIFQRSRYMGMFLLAFGLVITALEWYANFDSRTPTQKGGNCSPGNLKARVPQWVFYLLAMVFDAVTILLSSFSLIKSAGGISKMSSVLRMLFYDGLGYIAVLTAINVMNLILYRNSIEHGEQSPGASFGYTLVWIMSQRILIHIHEVAEARIYRRMTFSNTARHMTHNVRPSNDRDKNRSMSLDVQVQVEQAVTVDYNSMTIRKPRAFWERKQSDFANGSTPSVPKSQWELPSVVSTTGSV